MQNAAPTARIAAAAWAHSIADIKRTHAAVFNRQRYKATHAGSKEGGEETTQSC